MTGESEILAKLNAVLGELHDVKRIMHRLAVPVTILTADQAAERLGQKPRTLKEWTRSGVFTDARPPGKRVAGAPRLYYADEVEVYRAEGENGVRRLRESLGRV